MIVPVFFHSFGNQLLFIQPRGCNCIIKDLGNGGAHCAFVMLVSAADNVRHHPALSVGRPCQRNHGSLPCNELLRFYHIAYGVNILYVCAEIIVYDYSASAVYLYSCCLCKSAVRLYSCRHYYKIRSKSLPVVQNYFICFRFFDAEFRNSSAQVKADAVHVHVFVNELCHFRIHRTHNLILHFYYINLKSQLLKVLSHLQTDESATHNCCLCGAVCPDIFLDFIHLGNGPEGENVRCVDSFNGRLHRRRACGNYQLIIAFPVLSAGFKFQRCYCLAAGVYSRYFCFDSNLHIVLLLHALRGLKKKGFSAFNYVAYMIRKPAVGI